MDSATVEKLTSELGGDRALAEALAAAGLAYPIAIEDAKDREIAQAVGPERLAAVRAAFPVAGQRRTEEPG